MSADDYQHGGNHYKAMPKQPWQVMAEVLTHAEFIGFLKGSIIKYDMRDGTKPGASDDAHKAQHYRVKLAEVLAEASSHWEGAPRPATTF